MLLHKLASVTQSHTIQKWARILFWLLLIGLSFASYKPGTKMAGTDLLSITNSMLTVSAIIFGIMGAWIALIKADTEKKLEELISRNKPTRQLMRKVENLNSVITTSCLILLTCLLYVFMYHALKEAIFIAEYKEVLKGIAFSSLVALGLRQANLILRIVWYGAGHVLDLYELQDRLQQEHY